MASVPSLVHLRWNHARQTSIRPRWLGPAVFSGRRRPTAAAPAPHPRRWRACAHRARTPQRLPSATRPRRPDGRHLVATFDGHDAARLACANAARSSLGAGCRPADFPPYSLSINTLRLITHHKWRRRRAPRAPGRSRARHERIGRPRPGTPWPRAARGELRRVRPSRASPDERRGLFAPLQVAEDHLKGVDDLFARTTNGAADGRRGRCGSFPGVT